jgi:hypothetical protein
MFITTMINVAVFGVIYGATYWIAKRRGAGNPRTWAIGVTIAAAVVLHFVVGSGVPVPE